MLLHVLVHAIPLHVCCSWITPSKHFSNNSSHVHFLGRIILVFIVNVHVSSSFLFLLNFFIKVFIITTTSAEV
jgi:hypothetical protein